MRRARTRRDHVGADRLSYFYRVLSHEPAALESFRGLVMRTIKTSSGTEIVLDGDLLAVVKASTGK